MKKILSTGKKIMKKALAGIIVAALFFSASIEGRSLKAAENTSISEESNTGEANSAKTVTGFTAKDYSELTGYYAEMDYKPGEGTYKSDDWNHTALTSGLYGYTGKAFEWKNNEEAFSIDVTVKKAGLYIIALDYFCYENDSALIQRGILIDGESFSEANETCPFFREWTESGETYLDANGDEKPSEMVQVSGWRKQYFVETNGIYNSPLEFYLTEGTHTFTLTLVSGRMSVGAIYIEPASDAVSYNEYIEKAGENKYSGEAVKIEAETAVYRSDRTIRRISDSDPESTPFVYGNSRLNAIGGTRWQNGWESITWEIEVPEDALYRIDLRVLQQTGEGLTVYRRLTIDGELPFSEAKAIPFSYNRDWTVVSLGNGENPYYFYLTKGKHLLKLSVVSGELKQTVNEIKNASSKLSSLLMDINMIVGTSPDKNFDYELDKKISWLLPTLTEIMNSLKTEAVRIKTLTGKQTTLAMNLNSAVSEIAGYIKKPRTISTASGTDGALSALQTNLASWYSSLLDTPMTIDTLSIVSPDETLYQKRSNFFQRLKATVRNFFASFTKDYNSIASDTEDTGKTVSVWIARGREWGEALQKMCDEEFTKKTGIRVKINILPSGSVGVIGSVSPVLLSLVSGSSPNVCIGSDSTTPVELAIRDSVVDLSKLEGYEETVSKFVSGAMEPLSYKGGVYALPENMDFQFMIYRKDILERLNLTVPETWDELYNSVLPTLKQNNYEFYIPITTSTTATYQYCAFYTYLYQRGGDIYTEDGLSTRLSSEVSIASFKQWVECYTRYNMPREINVFNHFRIGDVPIFIGGLNEYLNLKVAAPELSGKWGVALIPGTLGESGNIDRSSIGALTTSFIFDKGEEENSMSWEFLKWYMSTETQYEYGEEIESEVGMAARWFTANTEAFELLSWDSRDLSIFKTAMKMMRNPKNVAGGYMTGRQLNNAWTRVVLNGQNYIEALEDAIDDIETELKHKQEEYREAGQ